MITIKTHARLTLPSREWGGAIITRQIFRSMCRELMWRPTSFGDLLAAGNSQWRAAIQQTSHQRTYQLVP